MQNNPLTFNDLPDVIGHLASKMEKIEGMLLQVLNRQPKTEGTDRHVPLTVEQACKYLNMPKATFYYKVGRDEIPAIKQGKRYYVYQDELDAWLESARKTAVPPSAEQEKAAIPASHRCKPDHIIR